MRTSENPIEEMKTAIQAEDLKGLPHILILKSDTGVKVIEFTGEDAMEKAHEQAHQLALDNWPGCITVAVRVRQLCPMKYERMMT